MTWGIGDPKLRVPVHTVHTSDADKIKKLEKEIENIKRCLLVNGIVCGDEK